jgi:acyl carrier protein
MPQPPAVDNPPAPPPYRLHVKYALMNYLNILERPRIKSGQPIPRKVTMPTTTHEKVINIVYLFAPSDATVTESCSLRRDVKLDNSLIIEVCIKVEEDFNVSPFTREMIRDLDSVNEIVNWIEAKLAASANSFNKPGIHPLTYPYSFMALN